MNRSSAVRSSLNYQICTKTIVDTTYPGVLFNPNGECNFVDDFESNVKSRWFHGENSSPELYRICDHIRAAGKSLEYDCIVGLSGGLDSSYMIHLMVSDFGLRPLVVHVDGGWNTDISTSNINCLVDGLNLDLYTEVIDWDEMRDFQLAMFKSGVPHLDTPQDMAFAATLYRLARKYRIPYILNGGNISTECVPRPLKILYWGTDMTQINSILRRFGTIDIKSFPFSPIYYHKIYLRYLRGVKVVKPLNYTRYIKNEAIQVLKTLYNWKPYGNKHYESRFTRFLEGYWLPARFNFDLRRVDLSSLILTSQLSRSAALEAVSRPPYDIELQREDFRYVASKLSISDEELNSYQHMPLKYYYDYPSEKLLFDLGEYILTRFAGARRGGAF